MKLFIVFSAVLAVCAASFIEPTFRRYNNVKQSAYNSSGNLREGTFDTPLDHFTPTDGRLLRQRYVANLESFQTNGPIFLEISDSWLYHLENGLVVDLARELNGSVIRLIPRYFDEANPINSTVENLRYLTIDHILADIPILINKVKEDLESSGSRVIVFGASQWGTIAALTRKKFPHIVDGVWSSSGFFRADTADTEYYNAVAWSLHHYGSPNCSNAVGQALAQVYLLIVSRNGERLKSLFKLCDVNFDNNYDIQYLSQNIFSAVAISVERLHLTGLQDLCGNLTSSTDYLESFSRYFQQIYLIGNCLSTRYDDRINSFYLNNTSIFRPVFYYECTQFGLHFDVNIEDNFGDVFPNIINQSFYDRGCRAAFGDAYNLTLLERASDNFNLQHGSQNQIITNAIFTNGDLDPHISHGISEYDNYNSEAVTTISTGAAGDMDSISDNDPDDLRETKERIIQALTRFATPDIDADDEEEIDPKFMFLVN